MPKDFWIELSVKEKLQMFTLIVEEVGTGRDFIDSICNRPSKTRLRVQECVALRARAADSRAMESSLRGFSH